MEGGAIIIKIFRQNRYFAIETQISVPVEKTHKIDSKILTLLALLFMVWGCAGPYSCEAKVVFILREGPLRNDNFPSLKGHFSEYAD